MAQIQGRREVYPRGTSALTGRVKESVLVFGTAITPDLEALTNRLERDDEFQDRAVYTLAEPGSSASMSGRTS